MRVRVTQPGFEGFTGRLGVIDFKDGLSVEDIPRLESLRLSAIFQCEGENGEELSLAQELIRNGGQAAPHVPDRVGVEEREIIAPLPPEHQASAPDEDEAVEVLAAQPEEFAAAEAVASASYTEAQLEDIADKGGIKALRDVADSFGIKSNSIAGLIREMVLAGYATATAAPAAE